MSKRTVRRFIPYSTQSISEADIRAVRDVMRSPYLTQGPAIGRFETHLAKMVQTRHAVALNSGTAALHAAYAAAGVGDGDEVIVPALTFAATANAALYLGARPIFADIDLDSGLVDPADIERKITKKTAVIVGVDYAGRPAHLDHLRAIAKKHQLTYIEDSAQSLGATYQGKPVGGQADMSIFSFHPVKSITTGEGGAVVTNNASFARNIRLFRTHGVTTDKRGFIRPSDGLWYQEQQELGFNYRLTDMQAALGTSQLSRLEKYIERRRALAKRYQKLLQHVRGIMLPPADTPESASAWHLYVVQVDQKRRRKIFEMMRQSGIGVQVHHVPVYRHPYYEKLGYIKGLCPKTELFYSRAISLPIFPALSAREQDTIVSTLKQLV